MCTYPFVKLLCEHERKPCHISLYWMMDLTMNQSTIYWKHCGTSHIFLDMWAQTSLMYFSICQQSYLEGNCSPPSLAGTKLGVWDPDHWSQHHCVCMAVHCLQFHAGILYSYRVSTICLYYTSLTLVTVVICLYKLMYVLWTVNFELSYMTSSLLDIHFLYNVFMLVVMSSNCYRW